MTTEEIKGIVKYLNQLMNDKSFFTKFHDKEYIATTFIEADLKLYERCLELRKELK